MAYLYGYFPNSFLKILQTVDGVSFVLLAMFLTDLLGLSSRSLSTFVMFLCTIAVFAPPSTFPSKRQISFKLSYLPLNCFQMYFPCLVSVFLLQCSPSNSAAAAIGIKNFTMSTRISSEIVIFVLQVQKDAKIRKNRFVR